MSPAIPTTSRSRLAAGARATARPVLAAVALLLVLLAAGAAPAHAAAVPDTVLQDDAVFLHGSDDDVKAAVRQVRDLGFDHLRITAGWSVIAPDADAATRPDFDATDPGAYPQGNWAALDRAVRLASAGGLRVMIDIAFWAPRWATKDTPDTAGGRLRTEIDPAAYAQFAQAVARRYSGSYTPPSPPPPPAPKPSQSDQTKSGLKRLLGMEPDPQPQQQQQPQQAAQQQPLPAVDLYTLWNEPNHPGFLMPQWVQRDGTWVPRSAEIYRAMIRAAYPAVKAVAPDARILIGGTASMGSSTPGRSGVPPLKFLRALTCVDEDYKPIRTRDCAGYTTLPGDGWAHHPYSLHTLPNVEPKDPDKLPIASTPRLAKALSKLVSLHRLAPANRDIYMTEYGYETNPGASFGPEDQGRLLAWAEYLATRVPQVKMWPQFLLRDVPGEPNDALLRATGAWHTGLFYADGTPKPALRDWQSPVFATCVKAGRKTMTMVWGTLHSATAPAAATVEVGSVTAGAARFRPARSSSRARGGSMARSASVAAPQVGIRRYVPYKRGAVYRLSWSGSEAATTSAVTPVDCPARSARAKAASHRRAKHHKRTKARRSSARRSSSAAHRRA